MIIGDKQLDKCLAKSCEHINMLKKKDTYFRK